MATRVFDLPFTEGVDEGVDRLVLPDGKFRIMQNARMARDGRVEARAAYVALGRDTYLSTIGRMYTFDITTFERFGELSAMR